MKSAVFVSRLPLALLYVVAWLAAAFNCYILRPRRAVVLSNLCKAFPEYNANQVRVLCRKYYFMQAEFVVETLKLLSCKKHWLRQRTKLINPEIIDKVDANKPILFLSGHCSNWEWAAQALFLLFGHPFYGVYKPLRSPRWEHLVLAIRGCFGGTPLPHKQFAKTLIKHRNQRCFFYVLADREPDRRQKSIRLRWLGGQNTAFYSGTAQLACTMRCAVFFVKTKKIKRGYYEIYLEPIDNHGKGHEEELLASYADKLARELQDSPENWYWGRPRWRWMNTE